MPATATAPPKMKQFRILRGSHTSGTGDHRAVTHYSARDRKNGNLRKGRDGKDRPDIINTDKDLEKLFGRDKFQRIHNNPLNDGLDEQTITQLKELAEAEEIELGDAHKKDDIISRIRIALG